MESRPRPFQISRPKPIVTANVPRSIAPTTPIATKTQPTTASSQAVNPRPLSDIRELSEPSVIDSILPRSIAGAVGAQARNATQAQSWGIRGSPSVPENLVSHRPQRSQPTHRRTQSADQVTSSSYSSTPERSSFYNIPPLSVPRRSSSQKRPSASNAQHSRKPSVRLERKIPRGPRGEGSTVPNRGQSRSPVKDISVRLDALRSDANRRVPSDTFIRLPPRIEILEFPTLRHPRVRLDLLVSAPLFVGGGSVEGQVKVMVDENSMGRHRRSLAIGSISVDLLGFEDVGRGRRSTFLALGTELLDAEHLPPCDMVGPGNPLSAEEDFWTLVPSVTSLPFVLSLPLDTGPPPFTSKSANIRFILSSTASINDAGRLLDVRTSKDIKVLATYDPEKALTSLPSPLTASESLSIPRFGRCETINLTAGLHRQVWVSGGSIFVDLHIANRSHKTVKKLELALERDLLCYKHSPATPFANPSNEIRIFENNEQTFITRSSMKAGTSDWPGVEAHHSETRTYELELPRGHATVRCGKYFEVRFFLNITASTSSRKAVSVQLPVILIHMNSLDVVPNSVAQVAAAIEDERLHQRSESQNRGHRAHSRQRSRSSSMGVVEPNRRPSCGQGRAFAAPRQQSMDRMRAHEADLDDVRQALDFSPRKFQPKRPGSGARKNPRSSRLHQAAPGASGILSAKTNRLPHVSQPYGKHFAGRLMNYDERNYATTMKNMPIVDSTNQKLDPISTNFRKPFGPTRPPRQNLNQYNFTVVKHSHLEPHVLGLSSSSPTQSPETRKSSDQARIGACVGQQTARPLFLPRSTTTSRPDGPRRDHANFTCQSRNEMSAPGSRAYAVPGFKDLGGLRRKGTSESLRDKGLAWWARRTGGREDGKEIVLGEERVQIKEEDREGWI